MDPNITLDLGIEAQTLGYMEEAREHADNLFGWILKDGGWPVQRTIAENFLMDFGYDPDPTLGPWGRV